MTEPYLGEIRAVGFNFAPTGWALCNGQVLSISQNTALFSLLGTTYGGDGRTTFALPDLQGQAPIHAGELAGGSTYLRGLPAGEATVQLTPQQVAAHSHGQPASTALATTASPAGAVPAAGGAYATQADTQLAPTGPVSGSSGPQPHDNMQPYLTLNYIIALQGIFPPRP